MKHIASLVAVLGFVAFLAGGQTTAAQDKFSGKVVETMDAGSYTYVLVDTGTNKIWAAATPLAIKPGDAVSVSEATAMNNFHSKTLNRDFPVIYFAGNITVNDSKPGVAKLPPGHPGLGKEVGEKLPAGHPAPGTKTPAAKVDFTGLAPVKDGKTVADIFAASDKLAGQSVTLRGKVVKYNASIMGKNWVHIQDGTGSDGSNDLLVTTIDKAKLGDTVLVEGKVAINQDFGAGYKYNVLIEGAKVTAE